jgi:putative flippase GtrA
VASLFRVLGRHQIASLVSTAVDFGTMVLAVEAFGLSPVWATALGASLGAISNFVMGRHWVFRSREGAVAGQAVRYGVVSAASAGWNTLGESIAVHWLGVQYFVARVVVAVLVSVGWNFPLQRAFVFRVSEEKAA